MLSRITLGESILNAISTQLTNFAIQAAAEENYHAPKNPNIRLQFDRCFQDADRWSEFNLEFLERSFSSKKYMLDYKSLVTTSYQNQPMVRFRSVFAEKTFAIEKQVNSLRSLVERLDLIGEADARSISKQPTQLGKTGVSKDVFLVHGHDKEALAVVDAFLRKCQLTPVILAEQTDGGQTIIEKFEKNAAVASFAIVLLTPDDMCGMMSGEIGSASLRPRARQNVILELGYFVGRLGRSKVCALKKGEVEIPSDWIGVVYTEMDVPGAWKLRLARELRNAGLDVDLNVALG